MSIAWNSNHWLAFCYHYFNLFHGFYLQHEVFWFKDFCKICQQSFKSVIAIVHSPLSSQIPATFRPRLFPVRKGFRPKLNFRRQSFGIFQHSYVGASWHWLWQFKFFLFYSSNSLFQIIVLKFCREVMMWSETFLLIN